MTSQADPWLRAVRSSQRRLRELAEPLGPEQLRQQSYCSEWSIAQVLSHLGSQAEIFHLYLQAGLSGQKAPGREEFSPIWDSWNAKSPGAQAADSLRGDLALVERLEGLDRGERERFRLDLFGTELDLAGLARMRLGEHAVHTWDVAVALDPGATVAPEAVELLVDTLGQLAARTGKPEGGERQVAVSTSSPERQFTLGIGEKVSLAATAGDGGGPRLGLPAEALVRLVYGRLDPDHTPPLVAEGVELDLLRQTFPGF